MTNQYSSGSLKRLPFLAVVGKALVYVVLWTVAILLFLFIVVMSLGFFLSRPAYYGVLNKDRMYYMELAAACNDLLLQAKPPANNVTYKGDDPSLPKPLLNLHATKVHVTSHFIMKGNINDISRVTIVFGEVRPDYVMEWGHSDYGNGHRPWELVVGDDVNHQTLYSTDPSQAEK